MREVNLNFQDLTAMAEWLFSCISRVYQHIMEILGRNSRTPVEHSEEGIICRSYSDYIAWPFSGRTWQSLLKPFTFMTVLA